MKSTVSKLIVFTLLQMSLIQASKAQGCSANFDYEAEQLAVTFIDLSSGDILTRIWDFGDGSNPGIDPNHTYSAPGEYEVCLTIGNFNPFCFDTYCETITVVEYTCEPAFEFTRGANNLYSFTNTTNVGNVTSVLWEFGDGNSSSAQNPTHSYSAAGTYDVSLSIANGSNTETKAGYVTILPLTTVPYLGADGGDFESNPEHFTSRSLLNGKNLWERGVPGSKLSTPSSGVNAWKTVLDTLITNLGYKHRSALYTPAFNLSAKYPTSYNSDNDEDNSSSSDKSDSLYDLHDVEDFSYNPTKKIHTTPKLPEYIWPGLKNNKFSECKIFGCQKCYSLQLQNFSKNRLQVLFRQFLD